MKNFSISRSTWKNILYLGISFACASVSAAPTVGTITIQGYMKKPAGAGAVTNGTYNIAFGVCAPDCTSTSNVLWVKKISTTVTSGLFSVNLTGTGDDLSADGTVVAGSNLQLNKSAATLNPALIRGISSGAIVVRAYAASTIDAANPQFDISISAVPTAYYAGYCGIADAVTASSISAAGLNNGSAQVIPSLWTLDGSQLTGTASIPASVLPSSFSAVTSVASSGNLSLSSAAGSTTTLGDGTGTSATTIQSGSGAVNINNSVNSVTNINGGTSTGAVNIATGTTGGAISIGTGATTAQTITIGNNGAAGNTVILRGGSTNGVQINASINSPTNINTGSSTGAVNIANGTTGGTINIGSGATTAQTITIGGTGNANNTLNLRGGSTGGVAINSGTAMTRGMFFGSVASSAASSFAITLTGLTTSHLCFGSITGSAANGTATAYVLRALATSNTCTVVTNAALTATGSSVVGCVCY